MASGNTSLQYAISLLATHSFAVKDAIQNPESFSQEVKLNEQDAHAFEKFIAEYGNKLGISARLAEKKRWESLLPLIPLTSSCIEGEKLFGYWQQYLLSYNIMQPVPESPAYELISFLAQLINMIDTEDSIKKDAIRYELVKNKVLLLETPELECLYDKSYRISDVKKLKSTNALFHPSLHFEKFSFNITQIVSSISNSNSNSIDFNSADTSSPELLLFSKRWKSDSVVIFQVGNNIYRVCNAIKEASNLQAALEDTQLDPESFIKYINAFIAHDILCLNPTD